MKSVLLVADENYFVPLVAQINSILTNVPDAKIYLVHDLSDNSLAKVSPFLYKYEQFNPKGWEHMRDNKKRYITRTVLGKWQVEFIEEEKFLYLDTDIIVNNDFKFENTRTMRCEFKPVNILPSKYEKNVRLMWEFIKKQNGVIEDKYEDITIISDGAFFADKEWLLKILVPKIQYCSKNMPQNYPDCWYGMGFFQGAIGLLGRPVSEWFVSQSLPYLEPECDVEKTDFIHFAGTKKPWQEDSDNYLYKGAKIWWKYYTQGPIRSGDIR
ncbi:MAG: glycosyltransferase [Candidatus Woesearchaeota archaeon]